MAKSKQPRAFIKVIPPCGQLTCTQGEMCIHACVWLDVYISEGTACTALSDTWGTLKADVVVGADAAQGLLPVDAPEALLQTGVDHFAGFCRCHPVCSASLHGNGASTDPLPVIEADRLQALVVPVPSRMVDVEPRRPLCHAWRHMEGRHG